MTQLHASGQALPLFSEIQPEQIVSQIEAGIEENLKELTSILAAKPNTWVDLMMPLEHIQNRLQNAWSPVSHMNAVVNTSALRTAYNTCLPKLTAYYTALGQNKALYEHVKAIHDAPTFDQLTQAQKQVIKLSLRDFELSGIALPPAQQARYQEIQQTLSKLQSKFSEHVLDATDQWHHDIEDGEKISGLPEDALGMAKQKAAAAGIAGYRFGLDAPNYIAVMTFCHDREIREIFYRAYQTRASDQGPHDKQFDNTDLMEEIVTLRQSLAQLLGYKNYAELSLATKMAETPEAVIDFLEDLVKKTKPVAQKDYAALEDFAKKEGLTTPLAAWDIAYYSERLKNKTFEISQEELKPYFPLPKVLNGMFGIIHRLYGMRVVEESEFSTWHDDARLFSVFDAESNLRGQFYIDLFARPQKRNGAWMDECRVRLKQKDGLQIPVAYLVCNFMPAADGQPALLTHQEVETLFHEFGHTLHHILTMVDHMDVSGINGVPWDAVELPSQFLENWCWDETSINLISEHYETGAALPQTMLQRLLAAKNFQSSLQLIRQLEFALFDFKLHAQYEAGKTDQIAATLAAVRGQVTVIPVPDFVRFQHGFSHIFAGGYAAGYYSYLWAEVLSADAFSRFEEEGILNAETGHAFLQHILEKGGSESPMDLFKAFRGRAPSIEPLLRHRGVC